MNVPSIHAGAASQQERNASAPSILLMGFYGRGNFGDDLMCTALADTLMSAGYQVTVATSASNSFQALCEKGATVIPRNLKSVLRALAATKILCQGGGTNFHDSYQGKYLFRQWMNLAMWAMLFWIARIMGARVIILGAGMGPLRHPASRAITRLACAACSAIGVRDQASVDELRKLGTSTYFELGFDLAALAEPESSTSAPRYKHEKVLGVSACSLTPFLGDAALNRAYWETMGDALALFVQSRPVRIIFFSLFTGSSSESDDTIIALIASRLPEATVMECYSYSGDVASYSELFTQCDWFLGTKYHAVLSAYLHGCPSAIVSYNRKMTDLAHEIRLPLDRRVSIDKIQPIQKWLSVLESLTRRERDGNILARAAATRRARETVTKILARANVSQYSAASVEHGR